MSQTNAPPKTLPEAMSAASMGVVASLVSLAIATALSLSFGAQRLHASATVIFGALTAFALIWWSVVRERPGGRAGAIAALATLGWLPIVALRLQTEHDTAFFGNAPHNGVATSTLSTSLLLLVPLVFGAMLLATAVRSGRCDRVLRWTSVVTLGVTMVGTVIAETRQWRPELDDYLHTLHAFRKLDLDEAFDIGDGHPVRYIWTPSKEPTGRCGLEGITWSAYVAPKAHVCDPLQVAQSTRDDIWVVFGHAAPAGGWNYWTALNASERDGHGLLASDWGRSVAPLLSWTLGGVLGSILGLSLMLSALRTWHRLQRLPTTEGMLGRDGWVTIAGAPPVHLPQASRLEPGPVLVSLDARPTDGYREPGGATVRHWEAGRHDELAAELDARVTTRMTLAMTTALLCAAPLLLSGLSWTR